MLQAATLAEKKKLEALDAEEAAPTKQASKAASSEIPSSHEGIKNPVMAAFFKNALVCGPHITRSLRRRSKNQNRFFLIFPVSRQHRRCS